MNSATVVASHDGEEAGGEAGDEIFAGPGTDDGVVRARDSGAVVRRHHQTHLDELARVPRQPVTQSGYEDEGFPRGRR